MSIENKNDKPGDQAAAPEAVEATPTRMEEFSKTSTAAKMSGAFNETAGMLKRKFGELTEDASLKEAGREQQMLGKIHRLVGTVRGVREAAIEKFTSTQKEGLAVCKKHGGRIIDVASDLVEDIKKAILK